MCFFYSNSNHSFTNSTLSIVLFSSLLSSFSKNFNFRPTLTFSGKIIYRSSGENATCPSLAFVFKILLNNKGCDSSPWALIPEQNKSVYGSFVLGSVPFPKLPIFLEETITNLFLSHGALVWKPCPYPGKITARPLRPSTFNINGFSVCTWAMFSVSEQTCISDSHL